MDELYKPQVKVNFRNNVQVGFYKIFQSKFIWVDAEDTTASAILIGYGFKACMHLLWHEYFIFFLFKKNCHPLVW